MTCRNLLYYAHSIVHYTVIVFENAALGVIDGANIADVEH